jgi:hypothetical protein
MAKKKVKTRGFVGWISRELSRKDSSRLSRLRNEAKVQRRKDGEN